MKDKNIIRVFEGFAGYGGASFALRKLKALHPEFEYEVIGYSEIDKFASQKFIWLEEFLKEISGDPKSLSEQIVEKARELSGKEIKDDMTVIASKVYIAG